MKLLVTGAAGFVGRHLTHHLKHVGHDVLGLVHPNDYHDGIALDGVDVIEAADRDTMPKLHNLVWLAFAAVIDKLHFPGGITHGRRCLSRKYSVQERVDGNRLTDAVTVDCRAVD